MYERTQTYTNIKHNQLNQTWSKKKRNALPDLLTNLYCHTYKQSTHSWIDKHVRKQELETDQLENR